MAILVEKAVEFVRFLSFLFFFSSFFLSFFYWVAMGNPVRKCVLICFPFYWVASMANLVEKAVEFVRFLSFLFFFFFFFFLFFTGLP